MYFFALGRVTARSLNQAPQGTKQIMQHVNKRQKTQKCNINISSNNRFSQMKY